MFNDEELQMFIPKMSIEYRIEKGFLTGGTFDNIPENACGAHIVSTFPVVGADGEFRFCQNSYDLFVGEVFEIAGLLEKINKLDEASETVVVASELSKEKIKEYSEQGIKKIVSTKFGVMPLNYGDAAFSTQEEMAAAINKINQAFGSVDFSVQNSETARIHR